MGDCVSGGFGGLSRVGGGAGSELARRCGIAGGLRLGQCLGECAGDALEGGGDFTGYDKEGAAWPWVSLGSVCRHW